MKHAERPLSPHLQVYRPQMTSVLSILHRAAGVALALGLPLVAWWLAAAAAGPAAYSTVQRFAASPIGLFMIFGWSVALFYHLCNGIRHLIWDTGYLFELKNAYRAGYVVLLATAVLTGAAWYCALNFSPAARLSAPAASNTLANTTIEDGEWR